MIKNPLRRSRQLTIATITLVTIAISWLLLAVVITMPRVAILKHVTPESSRFIYREALWLIPLSLALIVLLNAALGVFLGVRFFGTMNYVILAFNLVLVTYLIYLNY